MKNLKERDEVIEYSIKLNTTNLSPLRSGNISAALVFNDGSGNGACDGNDFYPGAPTISNTFKY